MWLTSWFLFYVWERRIFCWCQIIYNIVVMNAVGGAPWEFLPVAPAESRPETAHTDNKVQDVMFWFDSGWVTSCFPWFFWVPCFAVRQQVLSLQCHPASGETRWHGVVVPICSYYTEARWSLCMRNTGRDTCSYRNQLLAGLISGILLNARVDNFDHEGLLICVRNELTMARFDWKKEWEFVFYLPGRASCL